MALVRRQGTQADGRLAALAAASVVVAVLVLAGLGPGGLGLEQALVRTPAAGGASTLAEQQAHDDQAVRRTAADLAAGGGSLEALRDSARSDLAAARNDAVVATWLNEAGLDRPYGNLERYAGLLGSSDRSRLALGVTGTQVFAKRIHDLLVNGMTPRVIVISIQDQQLSTFDNGKQLLTTPITTGHMPDLATDIGPMRVLRKDSPWTMHSPWPKGSAYWYPDA